MNNTFSLYFVAAIAEEKKRQREELKKQRDSYVARSEKMKKELKMLKQQKSDLVEGLGKRSPSPKTNEFIKENEKLQVCDYSMMIIVDNIIIFLQLFIFLQFKTIYELEMSTVLLNYQLIKRMVER
jgi:type IV secretory pathway VirB4 component